MSWGDGGEEGREGVEGFVGVVEGGQGGLSSSQLKGSLEGAVDGRWVVRSEVEDCAVCVGKHVVCCFVVLFV